MLKAVLFDLDGTIHNREDSLRSFIKHQLIRYSISLQQVDKAAWIERFLDLDDSGKNWKVEVYQQLVTEFGLPSSFASSLFDDYIVHYPESAQLFEGVQECLAELTRQGYKIGLISNGKKYFQRKVFESLDIEKFFSVIIISEEVGMKKPERRIFDHCTKLLNIHPEEALYVGDHPEADVKGSKNSGMKTAWKHNGEEIPDIKADIVFSRFEQLVEGIQRLEEKK